MLSGFLSVCEGSCFEPHAASHSSNVPVSTWSLGGWWDHVTSGVSCQGSTLPWAEQRCELIWNVYYILWFQFISCSCEVTRLFAGIWKYTGALQWWSNLMFWVKIIKDFCSYTPVRKEHLHWVQRTVSSGGQCLCKMQGFSMRFQRTQW